MLELKSTPTKLKKYLDVIIPKVNGYHKLGMIADDIESIITSKPKDLHSINNSYIKKIIPGFDDKEFKRYLGLKNENRPSDTKYHPKIMDIKKVFNYKSIVGNSYFLAELLDQHTCIYCNRNYVITVGSNKSGKIIRAEYDHFYNQSNYPLLALSFFNLIPVCSSCNSRKNDDPFSLDTHLHPYILSNEEKKFFFSYYKKSYIKNNVKLDIKSKDSIAKTKIENSFSDLRLLEIYSSNSDKELKDLLDLRYKYSENYIDILINKTFSSVPLSKEDIYRMVFGIELLEVNYHKRPFSKFKNDIINELLSKK